MIGELPTALEVGGELLRIRSDFRVVLNIYAAWNDPELTPEEQCIVCICNLYEEPERITQENAQEAVEKAYWFCAGGEMPLDEREPIKVIDWEQDERLIFPAINKAAGHETRSLPYLHWWSFVGLLGEVGEGLLSQVLHIRTKRAKGKKLEKWEAEYYRDHRSLIDLKPRYTKEELAERDRINAMLG